ncbi:MAG: hypothetical protein II685_04785 [Clostridia bacterium]|nr:hypothetical protein [Clostridia bacterium]
MSALKEKVKDFLKDHKLLCFSLLLYLVVMMISHFFTPWEHNSNYINNLSYKYGGGSESGVVIGTLLYGISEFQALSDGFFERYSFRDLRVIMEKLQGNIYDFKRYFEILVCIMFFFQKKFTSKHLDKSDMGVTQKATVNFLLDNASAYILSLIAFAVFPIIAQAIVYLPILVYEHTEGALYYLLCFLGIISAFLLRCLAFPYFLYLCCYKKAIGYTLSFLNFVNEKLTLVSGVKSLIIIVLSVVMVFLVDLLVSGLVDYIIKKILEKIAEKIPFLKFLAPQTDE